ncbi:MAG: NAD(+)/NADH kinase [Candidatus Latescibacterota bacterium]
MKIAILANIRKEGARTVLPLFLNILRKESIDIILDESIKHVLDDSFEYAPVPDLFSGADMIISFGGDGSILYTARVSEEFEIPILGVNFGKVGFLAEISPEEISTIPQKLKSGNYEILERTALQAEFLGKKYFALNDVVLDRSADTRILGLTVTVGRSYAGEFSADGLIISTPTGSTAHSMAAGGPLVMPECDVTIVTPICPHSLTIRPMIINGCEEIRIGVIEGTARMAVDGQSFVQVPTGSEVIIRHSKHPVRIARFRDKTYFDILHTRLNWGVSFKLKNA